MDICHFTLRRYLVAQWQSVGIAFESSWIQSQRSTILTGFSRVFPKSHQANAGMHLEHRPWSTPSRILSPPRSQPEPQMPEGHKLKFKNQEISIIRPLDMFHALLVLLRNTFLFCSTKANEKRLFFVHLTTSANSARLLCSEKEGSQCLGLVQEENSLNKKKIILERRSGIRYVNIQFSIKVACISYFANVTCVCQLV